MSDGVLAILKLVLLLALYLFLARTVRAVVTDLYGPRTKRKAGAASPRPVVADRSDRPKPRRAPREMVVHPPNGRPQVVPLEGGAVTLGRSKTVNLVLDDRFVSDEHTAIVPDGDGWLVRDLGSTNGTFLNGAKVTRPTPLAAGDQVRIGKTRIEMRR